MANDRITKKPKVARQRQLSQAHIENNSIDQGGLPDMPSEGLVPDDSLNRGNKISHNGSKSNKLNLGLEAIDEAIFYYFENVIKPNVTSNGDMIDVPVIYGSGERWNLAQKDGFYRDKSGKIQTPLVMVRRTNLEKRRDLGNKLDANDPKLHVTFKEKYTKKNQYDNFGILNNRIPKKEFSANVVPDYVMLTYEGVIWTDYISQLNKVIEAINYASDSYWGDPERFKFMATIDSFNNINELSVEDGRIVKANFSIKLQAYIIPDNVQKKIKEKNTKFFSKAQIVLNQATTVIEEPSKRSQTLRTIRGGSEGGGRVTNIDNRVTNNALDDDWTVQGDLITNNGSRDVKIDNASLTVDIGSKDEDVFLIKTEGSTKLKVNSDGILIFTEFSELPTAIEGGLIYMNNELYFGL